MMRLKFMLIGSALIAAIPARADMSIDVSPIRTHVSLHAEDEYTSSVRVQNSGL